MLTIRPEIPEDKESISQVNREAFDGEKEAVLVEKLREHGGLTISLVAVQDDAVIGHIAYSPAEIASEGSGSGVLTLAPLAILPAYQNTGIGSKLVLASIEECRRLGHEIVVVVGHPKYYPRFGFIPAISEGLKCEFEVPDEAWMVLELKEGALKGKQGTVYFQPEFREAV